VTAWQNQPGHSEEISGTGILD